MGTGFVGYDRGMDENPYRSPLGEGATFRRKLISDRTLFFAQRLAVVAVIVVYVVLVVAYIIPALQ